MKSRLFSLVLVILFGMGMPMVADYTAWQFEQGDKANKALLSGKKPWKCSMDGYKDLQMCQ